MNSTISWCVRHPPQTTSRFNSLLFTIVPHPPGSFGIFWVLLGSPGLSWTLLDSSEFLWDLLRSWDLRSSGIHVGISRVGFGIQFGILFGWFGMSMDAWGCCSASSKILWDAPFFRFFLFGMLRDPLGYFGIFWVLLGSFGIFWDLIRGFVLPSDALRCPGMSFRIRWDIPGWFGIPFRIPFGWFGMSVDAWGCYSGSPRILWDAPFFSSILFGMVKDSLGSFRDALRIPWDVLQSFEIQFGMIRSFFTRIFKNSSTP